MPSTAAPYPRAWSECAVPGGELSSPAGDDLDLRSFPDTGSVVNPRDRLRPAGRRNPVEAIAQQVTERVVDLLVSALDVNELAARIDLNALLDRVDINRILKQVDLNALLDAHNRGEDTPQQFAEFMAKHDEFFADNPRTVEELAELDDLDSALGQDYAGASLDDVDEEAVARALGRPAVDDLAALPLTLWATEHNYSRLHPNLLST